MENIIKQDNYYTPEELEWAIAAWLASSNFERFHESQYHLFR